MIRYANAADKKELKSLRSHYFYFDDNGFNDYFFDNAFEDGDHFILEEDGQHISNLSAYDQVVYLNGKFLKTCLISGVMTISKFQNTGKMKKLLKRVLEHYSYQQLVTYIEAYNPEIYKSLGFELLYNRRRYFLNNYPFKNILDKNKIFNPNKLYACYARFMKYFNGYRIRDKRYYEKVLEKISAMNDKIITVSENDVILGYCLYSENEYKIDINEIIYNSKNALETMLYQMQKLNKPVIINTSSFERFDKIYDMQFEEYGFVLVKLNDLKLLNRLYGTNYNNLKEFYKNALWYMEDY